MIESVLTRRREAARKKKTEQVEDHPGSLTSSASSRETIPEPFGNKSPTSAISTPQGDFFAECLFPNFPMKAA